MIKGCLDCGDLINEMPEPSVVGLHVERAGRLFKQMPIRDLAASNVMLHGYNENARLGNAVKLFEQMPSPYVISWTSMIGGLDQNGKSEEGLIVFERMFKSGVVPNPSFWTCASSACALSFLLVCGFMVMFSS